jgi:acyl carrier protein phosphodiesterase
MNWLAHVFLSEQKVDFQLGNYLADPLKGKAWECASEDIKRGIAVHQLIDSYTDGHEIVTLSKSRLRERGLLRGVIVDMTYDYLLTKHWEKFSQIPKEIFLADFYTKANKRASTLPEHPKKLIDNLVLQDRLNRYNSLEQLHEAFIRIDTRLSPRLLARETANSYIDDVVCAEKALEKDFLDFFPELQVHVKKYLDHNDIKHWRSHG